MGNRPSARRRKARRRENVARRLARLKRRRARIEKHRERLRAVIEPWVHNELQHHGEELEDRDIVRALAERADEIVALSGAAELVSDIGIRGALWAGVTLARGRTGLLDRRISELETKLEGLR